MRWLIERNLPLGTDQVAADELAVGGGNREHCNNDMHKILTSARFSCRWAVIRVVQDNRCVFVHSYGAQLEV